MQLTLLELELAFRLHRSLMFFVNQRLNVVPVDLATPEEFAALSPQVRLKVRDAFLDHIDLIEAFVTENPARLSGDDLEIIRSWRHFVAGKFYICRELKKYTVFLSSGEQSIAYGVLALSQPFEELIGPYLPVLVKAVLLPFRDKIIYDGLFTSFPISFGPGVRRLLNDSFKKAKERHGIVTSLPISEQPKDSPARKARRQKTVAPTASAAIVQVVVDLTDQFCKAYLNDDYAVLCRKLAEKLDRKRPSPLYTSSPNAWASGIVRTIGWANFLHDRSQTPSIPLYEIDACYGISTTTGATKQAAIRKMFRIHQFDPEWTLPRRTKESLMAKKPKPPSPFEGRWRITSMEMWGQDFVDAEVEGFVEFGPGGTGSFQFGYVRGDIDYRDGTRDGKPSVDWSWEGNDEMDEASGRGWAVVDGDTIHGVIAFHMGDKSEFDAKRKKQPSPRLKKPKR